MKPFHRLRLIRPQNNFRQRFRHKNTPERRSAFYLGSVLSQHYCTELPIVRYLAEVPDILIREFSGVPDPEQGEGYYRLAVRLRTTIVVIDELPTTPDTLWLRLMGKGRVQEDAIEEVLLLPKSDPKRSSTLDLLVSWRISMEVLDQVDQEERRILMALSQAYLEWEQKIEQRGRQQNQRKMIASILTTRFGPIDPSLEALIPSLIELPTESAMPLLLQLSREELLERFSGSSGSR